MKSLRAFALLGLLAATPAAAQERSPHANYVLRCAGCHAMDGSGHSAGGIPDFRNLVGAFARDETGRTYLMHVPGVIGASLSDTEIAAVLNYITDNWGGDSVPTGFVPFTGAEVGVLRAENIGDVVAYRRKLVENLKQQGIVTAGYPWP